MPVAFLTTSFCYRGAYPTPSHTFLTTRFPAGNSLRQNQMHSDYPFVLGVIVRGWAALKGEVVEVVGGPFTCVLGVALRLDAPR